MNPCIGDRQLDPDDDLECELCDGFGVILMPFYGDDSSSDEWHEVPCPDCQSDSDPGEPRDCPEE